MDENQQNLEEKERQQEAITRHFRDPEAFKLGFAQIRPISGRNSSRMPRKNVRHSALLPRIYWLG